MNKLFSLDSIDEIQIIDGHILYKTEARFQGPSGSAKHTMYMTQEAFEDLRKSANLLIMTEEYREAKPLIHPRVYEFVPFDAHDDNTM